MTTRPSLAIGEVVRHFSVLAPRLSKNKTASSQRYLERQARDPFVKDSKTLAWRSRAAFKLLEIDEKFGILPRHGEPCNVVDLGSAPGGWAQAVAQRCRGKHVKIIGIDLLPMDPIAGVDVLEGDFMDDNVQNALMSKLSPTTRLIVLSDMMGNMTGHRVRDEEMSVGLCRNALSFFLKLDPIEGHLVLKHFASEASKQFLEDELMPCFPRNVKYFKPKASRKESGEGFWICRKSD